MIDEKFIKDEIYGKIANNKSLKIKDEESFKDQLKQLDVTTIIEIFNKVFERCPEPAPYQFDKSWDVFYEVGQKFLNELVAKKIVEKTDYDVVNIGIIYGNEPLHKWNE